MKCSLCNKEINQGKYFSDYWGNYYHYSHLSDSPDCYYCGRLISNKLTNGGKTLKDGKRICGLCSRSLVKSGDLNREYKLVSNLLADVGFDIRKYKNEIYLIDRSKGANLKSEEPGFIKTSIAKSGDRVLEISFKVFILKDLPRSYFLDTLAHELMHQWLTLHASNKIKPVLKEGSCNYAAYLVMDKIKTPLSFYIIDRLLKDPHPYYGKGFRKVLHYSKKHGHKKVIEYLKKHKNI